MKFIARILILLTAMSTVAIAEEESVKPIIAAQLNALSESDFEEAYTFASPKVRLQIVGPTAFGAMVKRFYPSMLSARDIQFTGQIDWSDMLLQRVRITDGEGGQHWFAYEMIKVGTEWRINGVTRLKAPGQMAFLGQSDPGARDLRPMHVTPQHIFTG